MAGKKAAECVKVVIRCRPMNEKEIAAGHDRVVDMNVKKGNVMLRNPSKKEEAPREFTFDAVYDWNSKQRDIYDETFSPLVDSVLNGYNGTIFAYGQTGTGKTFTMEGVRTDPELRGVIPNSFDHIFTHISRTHDQQYLVRASYLEIYQEEIRDLLAKDQKKRLELKERPDTGIYVKDLQSFVTKSVKEIEHVMNVGNQNRSVGATNMNEHSSRSHAIFLIYIECSEMGPDEETHIRVGKLNMVDLAGSERQAKTGAAGERLKEATKINLSLSALGNVISALVDGKSTHVPYRDSKLTRLLQDSLGGNARTVMVANMGPASYNFEESLTTLRYADRAKRIKNKPKINEDPKDALLREFQEEIAKLKRELEKKGGPKKGRRRRRKDGEQGEDDDDEVEDEAENNNEDVIKKKQEELEKEKNALLENHGILEEDKKKLLSEINNRANQLKKEQERSALITTKIKAMESKLLVGGKSIVDKTTEQERALEERRKQLAEQKRKEREMQQKLEEQDESAVEIKENFSSLQQEVDVKTKKLKKLFVKLQATKAEIQDLQEVHIKERQDLEKNLEDLNRELKLKQLLIENFVPLDERNKVRNRGSYNDDTGEWSLRTLATVTSSQQMAKRPVSAMGNKRPISEYARRAAALGGNPRYKAENIIQIELDMPNRTTRDYEGPSVNPTLQAVLESALRGEDDLTLDASALNAFNTKIKVKGRRGQRPKTAKVGGGRMEMKTPKPISSEDQSEFPTARGLVSTKKRL
ncbi:kinesin-II 95 kDa subunit-like [Rhopilema esculentum]|uniref:kinesin-II 95 kDa subunit-like n=1 Tax=Rhopilema esculentum TaxID=499914 RepID=UPI0031D27ABB|eukprot:gene12907-3660_t